MTDYAGYQYTIIDENNIISDSGILLDCHLSDNALHLSCVNSRGQSSMYTISRNFKGHVYLYAPTITYPPKEKASWKTTTKSS